MGDPEGLMSNKRKEAPDQFETHLEQLDNFSSLAHFDISSPHCLLHAITAGIQRLWDSIQRGGQSMDYERLQKLVAYVLKAVVISNYGDSAQLLGKVEDTEFEWLSTAPFPRPLTVAQALVGLALETRQGKSIRKKHSPVGQKRTKFSNAAALELTLAYCQSRYLARMDGGPTHLWAIVTDGDGHRGPGAPPRRHGYPGNRPQATALSHITTTTMLGKCHCTQYHK